MNKKVFISAILVVAWMGVIFYFSSMESEKSQSKSVEIVKTVIEKFDEFAKSSPETIEKHRSEKFLENINYYFRRSSHAFVYFVLSILMVNLLLQLHKYFLYQCNVISIIFCFLYACADEYHQTFVSGRTGRFFDTLVDSLGAILGCLVISLAYKLIMKHLKSSQKLSKLKKSAN